MVRILLIEDDRHIAEGIRYFLENEQFQVETVFTAADGIRALKCGDYHLVVLDVALPDGNGFDLFPEIRKKTEIPIIFLTARDEEEDIVEGFELGADEYITKPFRPRELLSRIKNVMRHAGITENSKSEIMIEDVRINLDQGTVYKNNERLELTAMEYKVLVMLFENKGRILTRTQILANIWDESENYVNDNTLTVYIKRLREKIEDNPNKPKVIRTVRGMGYQIGV